MIWTPSHMQHPSRLTRANGRCRQQQPRQKMPPQRPLVEQRHEEDQIRRPSAESGLVSCPLEGVVGYRAKITAGGALEVTFLGGVPFCD